ncbi:MAG: BLUF domain-containing protein [Alphaproteobacteria bacterium]|nr:BLUF domain-containing protein [Alphaproteobacteria bacterium]
MSPFNNIVTGSRLKTIAYTSDCLISEMTVEPALCEIALQSIGYNELSGINAVLFYDQHRFYQLIEGPDHAVRHLYKKIEADTRHRKLRILLDEQTSSPGLNGVTMKTYMIDHRSVLEDPSYARIKTDFKEVCSGDVVQGRTIMDFTRTMMTAFDRYQLV